MLFFGETATKLGTTLKITSEGKLHMRALLSLHFLFLTACSAIPLDGSEKVRMTTNNSVVNQCRYIGMVEGVERGYGGALGQGLAEDNARILLRNEAVLLGADTIFISTSSTNVGGSLIAGEAYRCIKQRYTSDKWGDWRGTKAVKAP